MERVFSQDERIRRAEEIYLKRQNLRQRTRRATVNVAEAPKNFRLFKKLILQIVICILIYIIFHLINTTNYSFSENVLEKVKGMLSYEIDFASLYNNAIESINNFLYSENSKQNEEKGAEQNMIENLENAENTEGSESQETNIENISQEENITQTEEPAYDESLTQNEISSAEESELDRIKNKYAFVLPINEGKVSSEYGTREVTSSVVTAYHKGIDIGANIGTPIYAATDGEVIIARNSPSYGNYIMLQNDEVKTVYAHCSELLVNVGDKIEKGRNIAKVGATR